MALAHRGHEQSSRGSPEGPSPAVPGSPHAPACPAYDRWRWRWPPAGNDPQCGSAPLFSLEGIYFGHPNPPKIPSSPPPPGQSWGPSLELLTGFPDPLLPWSRPKPHRKALPPPPRAARGGPTAQWQKLPHYLEAAGGAYTCSPSSPPPVACRWPCCVSCLRASALASQWLLCASVCASPRKDP